MHKRRSIRLADYDYSDAGAYFITICTHQHRCLLGAIDDDNVTLSNYGQIAKTVWGAIPQHFAYVRLDHCVVMPNHVHGILFIEDHPEADIARHVENESNQGAEVGAQYIVPLRQTQRHSAQ
ncbi:MAG: hypothetical protein H6670_01975 [Anaerolineaceae bacterium]|nr:hypothetical protein [Anaerolineaceae bacterium]